MQQLITISQPILAIIGLGNPGSKYERNRHNIGFRVLDVLAERYGALWKEKGAMQLATVQINSHPVQLIKPQTFMNDSGKVIPSLTKQGISADGILVIHDELEIPFGQLKVKTGGSHRGHNGLRSIMSVIGDGFHRLRFGIGRPDDKNRVPEYVLENFKEPQADVEHLIEQAVEMIEALYKK